MLVETRDRLGHTLRGCRRNRGQSLSLSLNKMCLFAARDIDQLELYLSDDGPDWHRNQIEELTLQLPEGAS